MAKKKKKTDPTDELSCCMAKEGYIIKVVSGEKTPEQIAQEKQTAERDYYLRWLAKKTKNCSGPQIILQKRTLNTAGVIRIALRDIPFNKLSATLYFFCRDMEYTQLARRYESQIELASIDPEKFTKGLHKFYNETAKMLERDGTFHIFAEFLSNGILHYDGVKQLEMDEECIAVQDSYMSLLMQQADYLRPNKFDLDVRICGQTTAGEIMTAPDFIPYSDVAADEAYDRLNEAGENASAQLLDRYLCEAFKKRGMNVSGLSEFDYLNERDKNFATQMYALIPYINEYSYDIVPSAQNVFLLLAPTFLTIVFGERYQTDELEVMLKKRVRTLPANGQTFEFKYAEGTSAAFYIGLFKEIFYNDSIVMLYKILTAAGEITGFYNTKTGLFFSPLCIGEKRVSDEAARLKRFVLFLYASLVTRQGDEMRANMCSYLQLGIPDDFDDPPDFTQKNYEFIAYGIGGKLRDVYHPDKDGEHRPTGPRAGNEAYEAKPTSIQGFIRRVADGRKPSQEAIDRAAQLGFDLGPDETYVQPFIRNSWKKKQATEEEKPKSSKKKRK